MTLSTTQSYRINAWLGAPSRIIPRDRRRCRAPASQAAKKLLWDFVGTAARRTQLETVDSD